MKAYIAIGIALVCLALYAPSSLAQEGAIVFDGGTCTVTLPGLQCMGTSHLVFTPSDNASFGCHAKVTTGELPHHAVTVHFTSGPFTCELVATPSGSCMSHCTLN